MSELRLHHAHPALSEEYSRVVRRLLSRSDVPPERTEADRLVGTYDADAIALCRENWRRRMKQEHDSAVVFSAMLPQLVEAGAGVDAKMCVLRSSMDELRHAALCGEIVELLGGEPTIEHTLQVEPLAEHPGVPPVERILRNLLFVGCLSETVAVSLLTEERELCEEPYVGRVLKQLAGDETLHARLGWIYLRDVWPTLDVEARDRTSEYLRVALAYYEQCMLDATTIRFIPDDLLQQARAIGFADSRSSRELFYETMDAVVIPRLTEIGLPAKRAWDDRSNTDLRRVGATTLLG